MNVLIIGNGGREHALAWKVKQSPLVKTVYVAPGNAGTMLEPGVENVAMDPLDFEGLAAFARKNGVELTIVGPEVPLVAGITDYFTSHGLRCFGPTRQAAQLEGSKSFSKDFLARHGIPTAAYQTFTETAPAIAYAKEMGAPIVIKADGLAAGKGVIIAQNQQQAEAAITDMLQDNAFGEAGSRIVVEEFLTGEEASFIVMVDGTDVVPFATSQDHKARDDGDKGPNTGGMGAYSPAPVVTPAIHQRIMEEVIYPTVRGMLADGNRYRGFLYAGLMIDSQGTPKVLEFNCRFGDPETQPIMMRLKSDLAALCIAACDGQLAGKETEWDPRPAVGVVMVAGGYPDNYRKDDPIEGIPAEEKNRKVFMAGTRLDEKGQVLTHGGRVLCATALGRSVTSAQQAAYELASQISWDGVYYRKDIAYRAILREQSP
jgi:phosphoribosylamine--glycine ligase